jgi:hypothetical protein
MENNPQIIEPAKVHRPTDSGVDLPAGKAASELDRSDYRVVEIDNEPPEKHAEHERR